MAHGSIDLPPRDPVWLRWQVAGPLVAATGLWFLGRVWHHHFSWPIWTVVLLASWSGALVAEAGAGGGPVRLRLGAAAAAGLIAGAIALRWLPRGLVVAGIPVAGLAIFHALMVLGTRNLPARRVALAAVSAGAIGVLAALPWGGPPLLRGGLIALAMAFAWAAWRAGPAAEIGEAPLILTRALVFSGGIILPAAWWAPALFPEFLRSEHVLLMMVVIVAASCRAEWRHPAPSRVRLTGWAAAALLLTLLAGLGLIREATSPARLLFLGLGLVSFLLGIGTLVASRNPGSAPWQRLVPDLAWVGFLVVGVSHPWHDGALPAVPG